MNKKKNKISLIVLLVILMLGLTYTSFAFWDQLTKTDDVTVNIGEGARIETVLIEIDPTEGKTLVPNVEDILMKNTDVKEIEYTITVEFTKKLKNLNRKLNIELTDLKVGGEIHTYD